MRKRFIKGTMLGIMTASMLLGSTTPQNFMTNSITTVFAGEVDNPTKIEYLLELGGTRYTYNQEGTLYATSQDFISSVSDKDGVAFVTMDDTVIKQAEGDEKILSCTASWENDGTACTRVFKVTDKKGNTTTINIVFPEDIRDPFEGDYWYDMGNWSFDRQGICYSLSDDHKSLYAMCIGSSSKTKIYIPDTMTFNDEVLPVTRVNSMDCPNLEELYLGANVEVLGDGVFANHTKLKFVDATRATKLQRIDENAFMGCTSLLSFDVTGCNKLNKIDESAFDGCTKLQSSVLDLQVKLNNKTTGSKTTESGTTTTEQQTTEKVTKLKTVYYKSKIKLSFDTSKIKTLKVNGKVVKSGKQLKNGKYTVEFTDVNGNVSVGTYIIDTKKPVITTKNKSGKVVVTVKDTNLGTVIVKGKKQKVKNGVTTITLKKKGKYVIKATDKAGNVKKTTVKVK